MHVKNENKNSRRNFLKTVGAIGAGSMLTSVAPFASASDQNNSTNTITVPTRPFGKTGIHEMVTCHRAARE